jgi:mono/diheme cytochrome c family protein
MAGIRRLFTVVGALALSAGLGVAYGADNDAPGSADAAKRGADVFGSHGCGYCHENGGRSAGKGPQLMGTSRDDSFIAFRIMNGKPARMPAFSSSLTGEQVLDIIAYIRSLKERSSP